MNRTSKIGIASFIGITSLTVAAAFLVLPKMNQFSITRGDGIVYTVTLNSSKRITESTAANTVEQTGSFTTTNNNSIDLTYYGVKKNNNGWQSIQSNGYLFNPVTQSGDHNKISGLQSIQFEGNASLSLYYGYSLNNEEIIYSFKQALAPNVVFSFPDEPSYFYLKNDNLVDVDIDDLTIKYSCSETVYPRNNLKVLMIGNSFADDTVFYSKRVAASYGINLDIYDAYIASCSIDTHYANLNSGSTTYSMRSTNGNSWVYSDNMSLSDIINSNTWDVITFQQASAQVGRPESYSNLSNLVSAVRTLVGSTPKFHWYQTWSYDHIYTDGNEEGYFAYFNNNQETMFDAIVDCYEDYVLPLNVFESMIPAGTAVQNIRTSYMGDIMTRDGKHMSNVHGRYLLACNFVSNLLKIDLDMSPCTFIADGMNSSYRAVVNESIRNARQNPAAITNSTLTQTEMANYDLTNYTRIDAGLVGNSYYNSTDSTNYNKRIGNANGSSNLYVTSNRFTSTTLPTGSLVFCKEGFGFRPEAWTSDAQMSTRPGESNTNVLEITDAFWSGYAYRAFNIFKSGKIDLKGQFDQIFDGFQIYVPNNKLGDIKTYNQNDNESADRALFTSKYLKFDSFERIHLDPIIGFYKCDSYHDLTNSYVDDTAKKFVCSRPFHTADGDLPENTVIIADSGYQWRSDCWGAYNTHTRPGNVTDNFTKLDSSFMSGLRTRTFNVSSTSSTYVGQNAINFMNHMRIYVPISDDIDMDNPKDGYLTYCGLGHGTLNSTGASMNDGKSEASVLITITGESNTSVRVELLGKDAEATSYTYDKKTGALSITTTGSFTVMFTTITYGNITGTFDPATRTISNVSISGSIKNYITDNGSVTITEVWHDFFNYSTESAANSVWQRWYKQSGSWQANSGNNNWTKPSNDYTLENEYSTGLRIGDSTYKTRFALKQDLTTPISVNGVCVWIYNPNGEIYTVFKVFGYVVPSQVVDGHAVPSSTDGEYKQITNKESGAGQVFESGKWTMWKMGYEHPEYQFYNIAIYFENTSGSATYLYIGGLSFY